MAMQANLQIEDSKSDGSAYSWQFFTQPEETWQAMYNDCANAKESIEFEQYILENDSVGQRFLELFIQKAKQGLRIFIICDMFGSALFYRSPLVRKLRKHGGRLHFYNPLRRWMVLMPWLWFPRTHAKTLLVDSKIAYAGGVCVAERMKNWRDTHMRITGPVIGQVRKAFDEIENRILYETINHNAESDNDQRFRYLINRPMQNRFSIYRELEKTVTEAKNYIYITSAFFVPNKRFIKLLALARSRGVDIKIIIPEYSDVLPADWLCLSYTNRLLKAGLRIFHYQKTILHSKTAIIDDSWATVGSTNFDILSFFYNREANIIIGDKKAIADIKSHFINDLKFSREFTLKDWQKIPLWKKAVGYCMRIIKVFLE